jgi:two-component system, OmpR family, response regulator MtrA
VDVHVRRLREKLGEELPLLVTVHRVGYRLDDRADLVIVRTRHGSVSA